MVRFLYDGLHSLLHEIMSWITKPTTLQKVDSGSALCKI